MIDRLRTLDLHFQDRPETIASYLLPHEEGAILIETGPGSTSAMLQARLAEHGLTPNDVTDILLTHIHLDHAGAAGWLASQNEATVYVHPIGAPHLADPDRLLSSAKRIYGDDMDRLWGETLSVPERQITTLEDGDTLQLGPYSIEALETPGHASHHLAYVVENMCFTGDAAGVRLPGQTHVQPPLVPPELQLDHWHESISHLRDAVARHSVEHLVPTHFGVYDDVEAHLDRMEAGLTTTEQWAVDALPPLLDDEEALREKTTTWIREQAEADGVGDADWELYETANPSWMAALGLRRYLKKHKLPTD